MLDAYTIGAPGWVIPAAVFALGSLLLVLAVYWTAPATAQVRTCAAVCKFLAMIALVWCLLEPMHIGERPRRQANVFALLVDNSQSMQIRQPGTPDSRRDELLRVLASSSSWQSRLEQDFKVRRYAFDARLENVDDYHSLHFDGTSSSLGDALQTVASRFQDRPIAGMLLFSDGNATDVSDQVSRWQQLGFPVHAVVAADEVPLRDLRVGRVSVSQTDFETSPVHFTAQAHTVGLAGQKFVAQLTDVDGNKIEEQVFAAAADDEPTDLRFRLRPEDSGVQFYRIVVFLESEQSLFERGDSKLEATLANNVHLVTLDRRRGPHRVLYVSGRPNWEFKFLRRALQEDDEVRLAGLVRIAKKEPKFSFRDRAVSSTNPLYSGFEPESDSSAEQYDKPVLLRFGIEDADELHDGFPDAADELFMYHAVILDDLETEFFSEDQMLLLRRFVSERGGGLLVLGGQESLTPGKSDRTPLGELTPVYGEPTDETKPGGPYRMQLTREGWLQPWMRLRETEVAERARQAEMPTFRTLNATRGIKPGASSLATAEGKDGQVVPGLVVQQFGKGRSAALLFGDMWRWSMHRKPDQKEDLQQAWRQLVRWLVSGVPRQVEVQVKKQGDPRQPVSIEVMARDDDYLPMDNATVNIRIDPPDGEPWELSAEPSDREAGVYVVSHWSREQGGYHVRATVTAADGREMGHATSGWTAQPAAAEFKHLPPNHDLLKEIARQTGGEVIPEDALEEFVAELPNHQVPLTERWVYPLWHQTWVLALVVMGLCAEWGLRRWKGLA